MSFCNQTTPHLCLASYDGDLAMVQQILQTQGANVQTTLDYFEEKSLERSRSSKYLRGMTPLFAAALKKHSSVVQYLIKNGANVSAGTQITQPFYPTYVLDGLTPLHAAFLELPDMSSVQMAQQSEIIQILVKSGASPLKQSSTGLPIWMTGWTTLYEEHLEFNNLDWPSPNLEALTLLIELGMSVTQPCSHLGRTLLQHLVGPVRIEDVNFIDFIIAKGADSTVRDKEGITPIMSAAIGNYRVPNILILEHLLKKRNIPVIDKIEALEMAAAVLLGREENGEYFERIFNFLDRANYFRTEENWLLTPEIPINGRAVEWITTDRRLIQQSPSEYFTQSLLMRFRILSSKSWGAVYRHLWVSIWDYMNADFCSFTQQRQFDHLFGILWTMLETIARFDQCEKGIWSTTHQVIEWLKFTLRTLREKNGFDPSFYPNCLKKSMILISATHLITLDDDCNYGDRINDYMYSVHEVISMLARLPNDQMGQEVLDSLHTIVSKHGRTYEGETFLLISCRGLQDLATIRLLLQAGADVNAVNENGDGALHLLADARYSNNAEKGIDAVGNLLLEYRANHMRVANKYGKTPADIWQSRRKKEGDHRRADGEEHLPTWLKERIPK